MSVKVLELALVSYLNADGTLTTLSGQGVWNIFRPEDHPYTLTRPLTWVTFAIERGGDTNDASGDRAKDVVMLVGGHADGSLAAKAALDIDNRLEALLVDWRPMLTGWAGVEKTQRVDVVNYTAFDGSLVVEHFYGANYRFRYSKVTP